MAERRYSEKETSLILRKAALIQASVAKEGDAPVSGYSLAELTDAARGAGLDPAVLEQAISQLGLDGEGSGGGRKGPLRAFVGAPWTHCSEILLDALPDREALENLLIRMNEICKVVGSGAVGSIGLAWDMNYTQTSNSGLRLSVRVQSKAGGGASIAVSADLSGMGGGLFGGIVGGMGLGVGLGVGLPLLLTAAVPLAGPIVMGGAVGGSYLLSRFLFGAYSRKYERETRRIAQDILESLKSRDKA